MLALAFWTFQDRSDLQILINLLINKIILVLYLPLNIILLLNKQQQAIFATEYSSIVKQTEITTGSYLVNSSY